MITEPTKSHILADTNNLEQHHPEIDFFRECGFTVISAPLIAGDYAVAEAAGLAELNQSMLNEAYARTLKYEKYVVQKKLCKIDTAGLIQISVDTKVGPNELYSNLLTIDRYRFQRELMRARDCGIKLYVLTSSQIYKRPEDFKRFGFKNSRFYECGELMYDSMLQHTRDYGAEFCFCKPEDAGRKVLELLKLIPSER